MRKRFVVSSALQTAVKRAGVPYYKLAIDAGLAPGSAYRIIRRIDSVRENDPRIIRLGERLGLSPVECFQVEGDTDVSR